VKTHIAKPLLPLVCALACCGQPTAAEESAPLPKPASVPSIPGWTEFVDGLRDLPNRMLARLPESMQSDPQVRQEIGRLALEALASSALDAIGGDGDYPAFLPQLGQLLDVGQPNADTIYRMARVTPGGTYRLRGLRGSLRMANIGQLGPSPGEPGAKSAQPGPTRVYHDLNALHVDAHGRFDVLLSPARPAGYHGDWWQLEASTTKLLLRMVSDDWSRERDPTITIERVDRPMGRPRRSAADLEQRLRGLPVATAFIAQLFVDHVEQLRRQGYVNKLKVFDPSQIGGLAGQFYYEGAYDLRDDEALIVEAKVPSKCVYRSIILTNEIYETTDWYNNHSSLNDSQAAPDEDGVLRVVVSAKDPGVANWLDTAGYSRGVIQGRWTFCNEQPVPSVRKVALTGVRTLLPAQTRTITSEERDREIRERRLLLQQRPLW
jgi:hypothetical protein